MNEVKRIGSSEICSHSDWKVRRNCDECVPFLVEPRPLTQTEALSAIRALFGDENATLRYNPPYHGYYQSIPEMWIVTAAGPLKYAHLAAIADMFKTEAIDIGSEHSSGSCDTCSYGTESWIELTIYGGRGVK